jgi:hypothetical protein
MLENDCHNVWNCLKDMVWLKDQLLKLPQKTMDVRFSLWNPEQKILITMTG